MTDPDEDLEQRFLACLPEIESVAEFVARRHAIDDGEREELDAHVNAKIIEDGYEVLRGFRGDSSLGTYLAVVIHRTFLDLRCASWGKWRPSAAARRLGKDALRLEELLHRDGFGHDEAYRHLLDNHGVTASDQDLDRIVASLPRRVGRNFEAFDPHADELTDAALGPEERAVLHQEVENLSRLRTALDSSLGGLAAEDRLIVRLLFEDGLTIAEVARSLGIEPRPLYRRVPRILTELRRRIEGLGIEEKEAKGLIALHED
jgi:RNA polymerase sigma factor (sigma-70 family)